VKATTPASVATPTNENAISFIWFLPIFGLADWGSQSGRGDVSTFRKAQKYSRAAPIGLTINHKPMDLLKVWSVSGGLPLRQRAKQRQAYRHEELRRWREFLGIPCNLEPAHHPVADRRACYLAIAAMRQGLDWSRLSYALLRAVWVEDRNIADHHTLAAIANENGMDGTALLAATEDEAVKAEYQANADEAMAIGVFGAPTYVFDRELFWGQDRLQMLEWRLTQKLGPPTAAAPNG
jgi:2-hydroxychromene-2-carboxylate isomerase